MHLSAVNSKSIIRISEPSMMEYFGGIPEFSVNRVRRLEHQHFQMIQVFIKHSQSDAEFLIANRLTKDDEENNDILAIFQLDHEGNINRIGAEHLTGDREHFAQDFKAVYEDDGSPPFEVTYHLIDSGEFHGISEVERDAPPLSQAIYETPDDENFHLALVEWEGDWLTAWFGKELRKDHIAFL